MPASASLIKTVSLGRDASGNDVTSVEDQVQRLINEATAPENLSQGKLHRPGT
jgi:hypothetical protein